MRYRHAINIWNWSDEQLRTLPIGQWVYAGHRSVMGRFYGQGKTTVVAWVGNGKGRWRSYCEAIRDYGRTVRR
jgi:hypothetical protein